MPKSKRLHLRSALVCLGILAGSGLAQRPSNASLCDYYAEAYYGSNTTETQQNLIRHIVALAFEGGTDLKDKPSELTGILRPGKFSDVDIDLRQYFNGSRASTNVNNMPIQINWLDQGGTEPLSKFLTGETDTVVMTNSSNQYHLFGNFFTAFSRLFACTHPIPRLANSNGPVQPAYAHKFMNLDNNQLGYFINQLTQSAKYYGFTTQDAETFRTRMNSLYNVRCAPAITFNPTSGPQLFSLCQNPSCPLAVPVSDCAAYENLSPNGISNSSETTVTATATPDPTTSATAASSSAAAPANSSNSLSTGAIAGIAVGGAAAFIFLILALVYLFRRRKNAAPTIVQPAVVWDPSQYSSPTIRSASSNTRKGPQMSYYSANHRPSDADPPRFPNPGNQNPPDERPETTIYSEHLQSWTWPVERGATPHEMDTAPSNDNEWAPGPETEPQSHEMMLEEVSVLMGGRQVVHEMLDVDQGVHISKMTMNV
ncbi:hypothetical protein HJFPF1_12084 [Paramyrothecium foliicola]|nr:hypothetical protein HJFPF1_12084 [Paramyrothecium foliicola]